MVFFRSRCAQGDPRDDRHDAQAHRAAEARAHPVRDGDGPLRDVRAPPARSEAHLLQL